MKFLANFSGVCCRMLTPMWAHSPTSGAGAARCGGRANRPGVDALYLSTDTQTAIAEYQQLSPLMPPGTLVNFQVKVSHVVDFSAGYTLDAWDPLWNDFYDDWRHLWFDKKIEPPSWVLGDMAVAAGAKGILFRSGISKAGVNLVLYSNSLATDDTLKAYDPEQILPRNADSWK